jgi:hypothetical protein
MTADLLPYQADLLNRLSTGTEARVVISAPAGVGISTVLVQVVAAAAEESGPVVVVVPRRDLLEQWSTRLRNEGVEDVDELRRASEALIGLERSDDLARSQPRVLLTTAQALWHGAGQKVASQLRPSLLIIELPPGSVNVVSQSEPMSRFESLAADLAERSQRVIVTTSTAATLPWLDSAETLTISLTEALSQRPSRAPIVLVRYAISNGERDIFERVQALFEATGAGRLVPASTRPAVYGTLTRLATRLSGEAVSEGEELDAELIEQNKVRPSPDLLDETWGLIDSLELLGDDARLAAVLDLANQAFVEGRPVLIITDRVDETEYVAARLRDRGAEVGALSASKEFTERRRLTEHFRSGTALVASREISETLQRPPGTEEIWWSPPRTLADVAQRVTRAAEHGRLVALIAVPPLPDDQRLLRILRRLETETGIDLGAFGP